MLWAHAYHRFYFHVLPPAGFEQQSFTHQISLGASRKPFCTHFLHWYHPWPLLAASLFSRCSKVGQHELWTAPWTSVGWVYRLLCLEAKAPCCALARGLAVPSSGWALTSRSAGVISQWYGNAFLPFEVAQTYWALHCRWHNLMGIAVRAEFMRGWKKAFSLPAGFQDPSKTIADCCQDWFCCNINDLSGQLEFHKHETRCLFNHSDKNSQGIDAKQ